MTGVLKKLAAKNLVNVFAPEGSRGNLLKWGENFCTRSSPRVDINENNGYFIIQFKKTIVHIKSYKMRSMKQETFPKSWNLFVSNDNSTWEPISYINEPLCKNDYIYTVENDCKDFCRESNDNTYSTNHTGFHYFVKFVMLENSYYQYNNEWQDRINLNGFELLGVITHDHYIYNSCKNKRYQLNLMFLVTITNSKN